MYCIKDKPRERVLKNEKVSAGFNGLHTEEVRFL